MKAIQVLLVLLLGSLWATSISAEDAGRFRLLVPISGSGTAEVAKETSIVNEGTTENAASPTGVFDTYTTGALAEEVTTDITTSGFSLLYVMSSGFGVGVTSTQTNYEVEAATTKNIRTVVSYAGSPVASLIVAPQETLLATETVTAIKQFLDFSYTFGDAINLTLGAGLLVGGSATVDVELSPTGQTILSALAGQPAGDETLENIEGHGQAVFAMLGLNLGGFEFLLGFRQETTTGVFDVEESAIGLALGETEISREVQANLVTAGVGLVF